MIFYCILVLVIAAFLACYFIRKIIYISHAKHLFDEPGEVRKIHLTRTPNLGGLAIFASMIFTVCLCFTFINIPHLNLILFSSLVLFILGLTDDLVGVNPAKKIIGQVIVALTMTLFTEYRFTSFYGLFGLHNMPFAASIFFSSLFIIFLINAFNLIDGINYLAGSVGFLACLNFAYYFWRLNETGFMFLSIAMCGCLIGFLFYNRTPARIFMGDTGSLFLGFIISILSIRFLELNKLNSIQPAGVAFQYAPANILALLIIPVYDTMRIFILRIINRKSPFHADRNHIHHLLIDLKLSHTRATSILLLVTIFSLCMTLLLSKFGPEICILSIFSFAVIMNWILAFIGSKKENKLATLNSSYSKPTHKIIARKKSFLKV